MGRRKKYFSDDDRKFANNEKVKKFYWNNKNSLDTKARSQYWKNKIKLCIQDGKLDVAEEIRKKAILHGIDEEYLTL